MKHLKSFNESLTDEIYQNVDDILAELKDDGFKYIFSKTNNVYELTIFSLTDDNIYVYLRNWFDNIKNNIESLVEYMKNEGFHNCYYYLAGEKIKFDIKQYEESIKRRVFFRIYFEQ